MKEFYLFPTHIFRSEKWFEDGVGDSRIVQSQGTSQQYLDRKEVIRKRNQWSIRDGLSSNFCEVNKHKWESLNIFDSSWNIMHYVLAL